jgi:hypothetical protein
MLVPNFLLAPPSPIPAPRAFAALVVSRVVTELDPLLRRPVAQQTTGENARRSTSAATFNTRYAGSN